MARKSTKKIVEEVSAEIGNEQLADQVVEEVVEEIINDVPLIFTSKGNLPESDLIYVTDWVVTDNYILFNEKWLLNEEVVKSNTHAYSHNPFNQVGVEQTNF